MATSLLPLLAVLALLAACDRGGPGPADAGAADTGAAPGQVDDPCTAPASGGDCVKIGGGLEPHRYEGWFCPTSACASGWCAARELGAAGRCGATPEEIREIVTSGEGEVLEGALP